jgi:TolB protein
MTRTARATLFALAVLALAAPHVARAQDTTFRGITLVGAYDPTRDKISIVVMPVSGAYGDSVRTIVQRDLDYSDRFNVIAIDSADPSALRGTGAAARLNYQLFARLGASGIVQITPAGNGLHVVLHDVARSQVVNIADFALPDGADEITVPTDSNPVSPAWNPAGTTLVYSTYGSVGSRLVLIDLATGRSRTLAAAPRNSQYITPEFMSDGNSILFARAGEEGSDIYSIGLSGSDAPRRLTVGRGAINTNPTPSPDGRRIVYVSNVLGRPELYIMDSDGTNADVLTNYDFSENNYRSDPDWSPDGRLIAYQERLGGRFQIRTIRASGGTPKQLTSEGDNEQPSWAPDARHLVFTSTRTGVRQLWIMDSESGRVRQLTKSAGSRLAAWSGRLTGGGQ